MAVLRPKEAAAYLGVSQATLWRMVNRGELLPPHSLSLRTKGWLEEELREWVLKQPQKSYRHQQLEEAGLLPAE